MVFYNIQINKYLNIICKAGRWVYTTHKRSAKQKIIFFIIICLVDCCFTPYHNQNHLTHTTTVATRWEENRPDSVCDPQFAERAFLFQPGEWGGREDVMVSLHELNFNSHRPHWWQASGSLRCVGMHAYQGQWNCMHAVTDIQPNLYIIHPSHDHVWC